MKILVTGEASRQEKRRRKCIREQRNPPKVLHNTSRKSYTLLNLFVVLSSLSLIQVPTMKFTLAFLASVAMPAVQAYIPPADQADGMYSVTKP
jgi:hypothetical protein